MNMNARSVMASKKLIVIFIASIVLHTYSMETGNSSKLIPEALFKLGFVVRRIISNNMQEKIGDIIVRMGFICDSDTLIDYGRYFKGTLEYNPSNEWYESCKFTPLHGAASDCKTPSLKKLIEDGMDLDTPACGDYQGWTALHFAASEKNVTNVDLLVKAGADINAITWAHWTPIHCSTAPIERIDNFKLLARAGANLTARANYNRSIIDLAEKESAIIKYLQNVEGYTKQFMMAINNCDIPMVRQGIDNGAIIVQQDQDGETPLHKVVDKYDPERPTNADEIAKLIVQTIGRQVKNLRNYKGQTPLHYAANNGNIRLMQLLLRYGADVNAQDNQGNTPLHYASDKKVINLLLQNNADISIENFQSEVPISALVTLGNYWKTQYQN